MLFLAMSMTALGVDASWKDFEKNLKKKIEEKADIVLEPEPAVERKPVAQTKTGDQSIEDEVLNEILAPANKSEAEPKDVHARTQAGAAPGSQPESPIEQLAKEDIRKATTIGNYLGMITGGSAAVYFCKKNSRACDNKEVRIAVVGVMLKLGSNIGSSIGGEIGETAANRRRAYASEHDYLESEIQASERAIAVREEDILETNNDIEMSRQRITELTEKDELTRNEIKEAKKIKKNLKRKVEKNNTLMVQYNEKIAYLDHSLATSEKSANDKKEDKDLWKKKHASLQEKRDALMAQRDAVEDQNGQLANDQRMLDKILS